LNSVDLPTLGRPMMMTCGSMAGAQLAPRPPLGKRNGKVLPPR
jgi:hypothetical protein